MCSESKSMNIGVVYDYKMQPEKEQSISSAIAYGCIFTSHGIIKMPKDGGVDPEVRDTLLACHRSRETREPSLPPVVVLDALAQIGRAHV